MAEIKMRLWWIPQVPMKPFYVEIEDPDPAGASTTRRRRIGAMVRHAARLHVTLANYDRFQYENRVKGDYTNAGGLEIAKGKQWEEWHDANGRDLNDLIRGSR